MLNREDCHGIAVLRLAHGKVSALDLALCEAVVRELGAIESSDVQGLVVTGTGSSFSAGVDLLQLLDGGADYLAKFLPAMQALFMTLLVFPKPAVAAINGHAIAGGCILAAACDHRVMADGNGRIGVPELAVGVPFPATPFEIVAARVAPSAFRQLVLSARTVLAAEARTLGLVDEVVAPESLVERAREVASELAAIPPTTFRLTKRTFTEPILARIRAASSLEVDVLKAWSSPDVLHRVREYVETTIKKRSS